MGALGKEAKLFQATMPTTSGTIINIGDKKHDHMNSSFNLTMTVVPILPSDFVETKQQPINIVVKEERQEEEED